MSSLWALAMLLDVDVKIDTIGAQFDLTLFLTIKVTSFCTLAKLVQFVELLRDLAQFVGLGQSVSSTCLRLFSYFYSQTCIVATY